MSAAGLVPVLKLAEKAGLHRLADQWLSVPTDKGANAGLKVASLVGGMIAGADSKIAVVIYEPIGSDTSRVYRGLRTALEFKQAGDDVVVVFDGSGVESLAAISDPGHKMNPLAVALQDNILGACGFCVASTGSPTRSRRAVGRCSRNTRVKPASATWSSRATRSSTSERQLALLARK